MTGVGMNVIHPCSNGRGSPGVGGQLEVLRGTTVKGMMLLVPKGVVTSSCDTKTIKINKQFGVWLVSMDATSVSRTHVYMSG